MNIKTLIAVCITSILVACGGGGSSSGGNPPPTNNTPPPAAQPTPVTVNGVITGFSSVIVDGETYEVESDTEVAIEGQAVAMGDDSDLRVGMRVRIQGSDNNGQRTADRIDYDDDLKGPARDITSNADNPAVGSFQVLGQTVIVDEFTVFDDDVGDNNIDGNIDIRDLVLTTGTMIVEVSGLLTDSGFVATRIDRENGVNGDPSTDDDEFEIKGFVDTVATDGSSIVINSATILIQANTVFEDGLMADQSLVDVFVEVKLDEQSNGDLLAVEIEREDDFGDRDGRFEIRGILSSVDTSVTPNVVVIGPTTLDVDDASSLVGLEGSLVEVKGDFDTNGVLVIAEAEVEEEHSVRTEDRIDTVDAAGGSFTTRLGLVIEPTGGSRIEDDTADDGDHLTPQQFLDRLQPDDFIEARGVPTAGGVNWTRIEREDEDEMECELQGPVSEITGTDSSDFGFVIQGVTIDVSQVQNDDFENHNDMVIGRDEFFAQLSVGDVVEAESDDTGNGCTSGQLTAREVEFELNDGVVGTNNGNGGASGNDEVTGTPQNVTASAFELNGATITVVGSTLIDDSIIERALGREFDGDDQRFDQVPEGLTLPELLTGEFAISVTRNSDNVALRIEDL